MKYLIALIAAVMLSGCHQMASNIDIQRAAKACGGVDKVVEIMLIFSGREIVTCTTGKSYDLAEVNLEN